MSDLNQPTDPAAKLFVLKLNPEQREYFEERSAIYEFEGGLIRTAAEQQSIKAVLKQWPELADEGTEK